MILDVLGLVAATCPPVLVFENVPGWLKSASYQIASLRLRRWGYRVFEGCASALDHGGLSSRKRAYVVASMLPAPFEFEPEQPRPTNAEIQSVIDRHLASMRNVSGNGSLCKGRECGRLRVANEEACSFPTITKSQSRGAKDSMVIERNGELYWPTEALMKEIVGVDVNLSTVGATLASEILGQSIDGPHHSSVMRAVRRHIDAWRQEACGPEAVAA